jgi:hypothetical protein
VWANVRCGKEEKTEKTLPIRSRHEFGILSLKLVLLCHSYSQGLSTLTNSILKRQERFFHPFLLIVHCGREKHFGNMIASGLADTFSEVILKP